MADNIEALQDLRQIAPLAALLIKSRGQSILIKPEPRLLGLLIKRGYHPKDSRAETGPKGHHTELADDLEEIAEISALLTEGLDLKNVSANGSDFVLQLVALLVKQNFLERNNTGFVGKAIKRNHKK